MTQKILKGGLFWYFASMAFALITTLLLTYYDYIPKTPEWFPFLISGIVLANIGVYLEARRLSNNV